MIYLQQIIVNTFHREFFMKKMLSLLFALCALTVVSADVEVEETQVIAAAVESVDAVEATEVVSAVVVKEEEVAVAAPVVDAEVVTEVLALS
jgi:hypothetical protein